MIGPQSRLIMIALLALVAAVGFFACGGGNTEETRDVAEDDDTDDGPPPPVAGDDDNAGPDDDDDIPTGYGVGERMPDFSLEDANGDLVRLYDYRGQVILLASSATWCPACAEQAPYVETNFYQKYKNKGDGLFAMDLLGENASGSAPSGADLAAWAESSGLTFPVLADPNWTVGAAVGNGYIPFYWVLDQDLVIAEKGNDLNVFDAVVRSLLGL